MDENVAAREERAKAHDWPQQPATRVNNTTGERPADQNEQIFKIRPTAFYRQDNPTMLVKCLALRLHARKVPAPACGGEIHQRVEPRTARQLYG